MQSKLHNRGEHVQRQPKGTAGMCRYSKTRQSAARSIMRGILLVGIIFLGYHSTAEANGPSIQQVDYQDGIPRDIRQYFDQVGAEFNICPELMEAMAYR